MFRMFLHSLAFYALALPIGWDREKEARSAGLRTFPLVALASCGFVQATETLLINSPEGTARIGQGLITGKSMIADGERRMRYPVSEKLEIIRFVNPPRGSRATSMSGSFHDHEG